jgi:hypothetical protein
MGVDIARVRTAVIALVTASAPAEPAPWPEGMEMIRQVRDAAGLFAGAMPISPQMAWDEALDRIRGLNDEVARRSFYNVTVTFDGPHPDGTPKFTVDPDGLQMRSAVERDLLIRAFAAALGRDR